MHSGRRNEYDPIDASRGDRGEGSKSDPVDCDRFFKSILTIPCQGEVTGN